jgi:integrase
LEWRDLDLDSPQPSVTVRRSKTKDGKIADKTKNGKHRRVPLRRRVVAELNAMPRRIDTRLVFPAAREVRSTCTTGGRTIGTRR